MLAFFARERIELTFYVPASSKEWIKKTNLSKYEQQCFYLVKAGYGSLKEIQSLDTPHFLNALEYEYIASSIQAKILEDARRSS